MGLIEYYLIFAFTTSIFALIDIFIPVMQQARKAGVDNVLTQNPKLSYFVYFCITAIIAPIIILPVIVPSMNTRFREGLSNTVNEQE
jgi:uncharacterized membrane protein YdjX (TVP38/TMEM64 family)